MPTEEIAKIRMQCLNLVQIRYPGWPFSHWAGEVEEMVSFVLSGEMPEKPKPELKAVS